EQRLRNYWMMSQRSGTLTYLLFSAGAACIVYAVFILLTDVVGIRSGVLYSFGINALAAYLVHEITMTVVTAFVPETSAAVPVCIGLTVFLSLTWWIIRWLERHQIQLRM
ncbi:MAG: hypothetical protein JNL58_16100, partial [Planctomyces sp.]|nr:hypothetical protein [Planctomyces sp.]